jgi:hypothetical protein
MLEVWRKGFFLEPENVRNFSAFLQPPPSLFHTSGEVHIVLCVPRILKAFKAIFVKQALLCIGIEPDKIIPRSSAPNKEKNQNYEVFEHEKIIAVGAVHG